MLHYKGITAQALLGLQISRVSAGSCGGVQGALVSRGAPQPAVPLHGPQMGASLDPVPKGGPGAQLSTFKVPPGS